MYQSFNKVFEFIFAILFLHYNDTNRKTIYLRVKTNICSSEIGCLKLVAFFLNLGASLVNKKSNFATDIQ